MSHKQQLHLAGVLIVFIGLFSFSFGLSKGGFGATTTFADACSESQTREIQAAHNTCMKNAADWYASNWYLVGYAQIAYGVKVMGCNTESLEAVAACTGSDDALLYE